MTHPQSTAMISLLDLSQFLCLVMYVVEHGTGVGYYPGWFMLLITYRDNFAYDPNLLSQRRKYYNEVTD